MKENKTVGARLNIEMLVNCPNDECDNLIDILNEKDTDGQCHDDEGYLLRQMFPTNGSHDDFGCDEVVCSKCKTEFNVKGLEW